MKNLKKRFPIKVSLLWAVLFLPMLPMIVIGMDIDDYPPHLLGTLGVMVCWGTLLLVARGRFRSVLLVGIGSLSLVPWLLNVGWFSLSHELLHENQYWAIFDTNLPEVNGFLHMVPCYGYFLLFIALTALLALLVMAWRESLREEVRLGWQWKVLCILLFVLPMLLTPTRRSGFPINFYSSFRGYITDLQNMRDFMNQRPNLEGRVICNYGDSARVVVVVIGESFNRNRSNLYGYERITNPRLTQMGDSLIRFQSVSSPDFMTQVCLTKMLTFPDTIQVTRTEVAPTLIEVLKQAGYYTYWLDNQGSRGRSDTFIPTSYRMLAAQADFFYVNPNNLQDETLLPILDSVLMDSVAERKVIFLHLMGNHFPYAERVPEYFHKPYTRADRCPSSFQLTKEQMDVYNAYDNSLVYHDDVLYQIIKRSIAHTEVSSVIYLSDHGEEVFDDYLYAGRSHKYKSHNLYDIPCLLYLREKRNLDTNIPYNSGLLAFTILQLCDVVTECSFSDDLLLYK